MSEPGQLDHKEAAFMRLVERTQVAGVRDMLLLNKTKLVDNEVVSEEALQGLTLDKLMACGLSEPAATALKVAFPTPTAAGAGGAAGGSGAELVSAALQQMTSTLVSKIQSVEASVGSLKDELCRTIEVAASDCKSSQWDTFEPQLSSVVRIKFTFIPCCQPQCKPVQVPAHVWAVKGNEDDSANIAAALEFLKSVLPPDIGAVAVQGVKWLSGTFRLANIKLVITGSKTDYLLVYKPAWDVLMRDLATTDGHKVSGSARLRDRLPYLLPWILGFYEAKTPTAFSKQFKRSQSQAILEHLAAWHMMDRKEAPLVLFGDFKRTYCVHGSGDLIDGIPGIHVAGPRLDTVAEEQPADQPDSAPLVWGFVRVLLESAKTRLPTTGPVAWVTEHTGLRGGVASGSHAEHSISGQQGGAWSISAAQGADRAEDYDTDMEEAAKMNAHAQQLMSLMTHPEVYTGFGLECPPTTLEMGSAEETWAQVKVLSFIEPTVPDAHSKQVAGRERAL